MVSPVHFVYDMQGRACELRPDMATGDTGVAGKADDHGLAQRSFFLCQSTCIWPHASVIFFAAEVAWGGLTQPFPPILREKRYKKNIVSRRLPPATWIPLAAGASSRNLVFAI